MKNEAELKMIREAQNITEEVMEMACSTLARCSVDAKGILQHDGAQMTSERMRVLIDVWLLERGCVSPDAIVAGGPVGADCHDHGHGPLYTGQPIIVDIFPRVKATLYNGDCTRTVVNGQIHPDVARMHAAVVAAKAAAIRAVRAGVTGQEVHEATTRSIEGSGYQMGLPGPDAPETFISMTHGTGHGLGLEVHEPPLLAIGGPELVEGDVVTIEPGLYGAGRIPSFAGLVVDVHRDATEEGALNRPASAAINLALASNLASGNDDVYPSLYRPRRRRSASGI
jgi:Xaa-Pro aminopeptidase